MRVWFVEVFASDARRHAVRYHTCPDAARADAAHQLRAWAYESWTDGTDDSSVACALVIEDALLSAAADSAPEAALPWQVGMTPCGRELLVGQLSAPRAAALARAGLLNHWLSQWWYEPETLSLHSLLWRPRRGAASAADCC